MTDGPEVTDAAVELACRSFHGDAWDDGYFDSYTEEVREESRKAMRRALAAAAPELCREAWVYVTRVKDARSERLAQVWAESRQQAFDDIEGDNWIVEVARRNPYRGEGYDPDTNDRSNQ